MEYLPRTDNAPATYRGFDTLTGLAILPRLVSMAQLEMTIAVQEATLQPGLDPVSRESSVRPPSPSLLEGVDTDGRR